MRIILHSRSLYIIGAIILIGIALFSLIRTLTKDDAEVVTATVSRGDVREIVSVSGVVESNTTAHLSFPVSDIVESVTVHEGDEVVTGMVLATLRQGTLPADRSDAVAALQIASADRDELLSGPTSEERALTSSAVRNAEETLTRTIREETEKVTNARTAFYSNELEAISVDEDEDATPPTITGAYQCETEGAYKILPFLDNSASGFSIRISGLESGAYPGTVGSAAGFGTCGLLMEFSKDSNYNSTRWTIQIPNTNSSAYVSLKNAYELAKEQAANTIAEAEEALDVALKEQSLENATPREEALRRANANVMQAEARLAAINARIAERVLTAPFSGIVTNIDVVAGETVSTNPIITLVGENTFDLSARIPEIDIAKIAVLHDAEVIFDARTNEIVPAKISFISPLATEIDGVAYFEATLTFPEAPEWLRAGLNADIDITVAREENALRLPKRFVNESEGVYTALVQHDDTLEEKIIDVDFIGNDGFLAISGLEEGTEVVAP